MNKILCSLLGFLATTSVGFSWSAPGHQAIGEAALTMIKGSPAEAKVKALLDGQTIDDAAVWLDDIRENVAFPTSDENTEAATFKANFPKSPEWHFCNFSVGSTAYSAGSKYASQDDIVNALETAIGVLEGKPSKMTQLEALRTVVHLVGDIHQPLHCITGFYNLSNPKKPVLLADVPNPASAIQDRGGNQLYYTSSEELHALWDLTIPAAIGKTVPELAAAITPASLASQPLTSGDYHHWAEVWAGESMVQANAAYAGIVYVSSEYVPDPRHPGKKMLKISVNLPRGIGGYKANQEARAKEQLTRASVRLAQLLEKISYDLPGDAAGP